MLADTGCVHRGDTCIRRRSVACIMSTHSNKCGLITHDETCVVLYRWFARRTDLQDGVYTLHVVQM